MPVFSPRPLEEKAGDVPLWSIRILGEMMHVMLCNPECATLAEYALSRGRLLPSMATRIGPLAVVGGEPRQARKGAAAATDPGAGVWLVGVATLFPV